jgi:hypothetical protein
VLRAYAAASTMNQNYANILLMLLRLCQAYDRPFLSKIINFDYVGKVSLEIAEKIPRDMQINLLNCLETLFAICRVCDVSVFFFFFLMRLWLFYFFFFFFMS